MRPAQLRALERVLPEFVDRRHEHAWTVADDQQPLRDHGLTFCREAPARCRRERRERWDGVLGPR